MMARIQAREPVVTAGIGHRPRRMASVGYAHTLSTLLLLLAGIAAPAYAVNTTGGDTASGLSVPGGYYGQFYEPGEVPAASVTVPPEAVVSAEALRSRYVAPDAAGLVYQPGFRGCSQRGNRYLRFGVSVAEIYTDNVNLASSGEEEDAFVTEVAPTMHACANTGRIKGTLDYQLQALYFAGEDDPFEIYHDVLGATTMEILPGHLFLAADSSYSQTVIDASDAYSESNLLNTGNSTSAWLTNISPYWVQRLGPVGRATLRYRYGRAEYGSDDVSDYTMQGVYFNLSNPPTNTTWFYRLSIASQRVENELTENNTQPVGSNAPRQDEWEVTHFDSATLRVGYQATDSLRVYATGGVENDYHADGSVDRYGSALWNVGFRWASLSNSLEARYGHRSFGSTFFFKATHRSPLFNVSVVYAEEKTASGLNELNRNFGVFGGVASIPRGRPGSIRDRGVFVRKQLSALINFGTRRTRITLQAYDGSKEFITGNEADEDFYGAAANLSYRLGARTRLWSGISWEHRESGEEEAKTGEVDLGVTYEVSRSSRVALSYSHGWRNADTADDSYDENRIVARYSVFF